MLLWIFLILFLIWTIKLNINKIPGKRRIQKLIPSLIFSARTFQSAPVWVSGEHDDGGPDPPLPSLPSDARHVRGVRPGDEGHAGGPGVDRPLRPS